MKAILVWASAVAGLAAPAISIAGSNARPCPCCAVAQPATPFSPADCHVQGKTPAGPLVCLLICNNGFVSEKAADALQEMGGDAVAVLKFELQKQIDVAKDPNTDPNKKAAAIEAARRIATVLGSIEANAADATSVLIKAAKANDFGEAQEAAIEALGRVATKYGGAPAALSRLLNGSSWKVQILAAEALGRIYGKK